MNRFLLVMPTLGRQDAVYDYIKSLESAKSCHQDRVKLTIVNQNDKFDFSDLSSRKIDVVNVNSNEIGLSLNRNIGMDDSGEFDFIGFPDDDCLYYPDTLDEVGNFFHNNPEVDIVIGRIFDRDKNRNIIKNWPSKSCDVNMRNFYFLSSSITIFTRSHIKPVFDEVMGAGQKYGSCEDPDFLYSSLKNGYKVVYSPNISVWHPEVSTSDVDLDKVKSYAQGFGFFVIKNISIITLLLFFACILKKIAQLILDPKCTIVYSKYFFSGLFKGFLKR